MITPDLRQQLELLAERHRHRKLWRELAILWGAIAVLGAGLFVCRPWYWLPVYLGAIIAGRGIVWLRNRRRVADYRWIARDVEKRHPELQTLLLAALDQQPDPQTGALGWLQTRVVREAQQEGRSGRWLETVPQKQLSWLRFANFAGAALSLILFLAMIAHKRTPTPASSTTTAGVEVTPGDAQVERGTPLTVLARFAKTIPGEVSLRIGDQPETSRSLPLTRNLNDPVFGATLPAVEADMTYHVEFSGGKTRDYKVTVFDLPKLERADARLIFPAYTKLPEKTIEDTRAVSAVESTRLEWVLRTNKPVASARLVDRVGKTVPLVADAKDRRIQHATMTLDASHRYKLELADAEGRKNKHLDEFDIKVFPNKPPEIKVRFPAADARVSQLEEMRFEADVTDDFGLQNAGLTYAVAGKAPQTVNIPQTAPPPTKQHISQMLRLEEEGVKPNDLVTWYVWAEDAGPDGAPRRTQGDVHFATVRHFEEIFHPGQSAEGEPAENPGQQLIEMQKQIIQATWNVQRGEHGPKPSADFSKNTPVLKKSQEVAIETAQQAAQMASQPEARAILAEAQKHMQEAVTHLGDAGTRNSLEALPPALDSENAAYRALLKLANREWSVVQSRSSQSGQNTPRERQQELENLDMKRNDDRYETERQASAEMNPQQKEGLQVLSRLRELAQRQQDLNEKLKELEIGLQTAKTPEERAEMERELKRLREKQQEMLADMDQLNQRMNEPDNRSQMSNSRQQLENSRESARRAAEELEKGNAGKALTAGSRAERDLSKLRDDFRQQTSGEFTQQMRQMREEARELARKQDELGEKLANSPSAPPTAQRTLRDAAENESPGGELIQQAERLGKLLDNMREVSLAAETSEPVLSRKLLDGVRQADHSQAKEALENAAQLAGKNAPGAAGQEARAREAVGELKRDVEGAAESVLGNDLDALRFAKGELDELTRQVENETAAAQGKQASPGQRGQPGGQAGGNVGNGSGEAGGPINGDDFTQWSDRMRNVEEIVEQPELRDALVKAREAAREMRVELKRHGKPPQWNLVRERIAAPLAEAGTRLAAELARRGSKDPLAPVERDPVPDKYAEVVRKYYEQLGK